MTATARQRAPQQITDDQRKALFAAAKEKGLDIDDIRALCPKRSISKLSYYEAWDVLNRLNGKPPRSNGWQRTGPRRERREKGVIAQVTPEQLELINQYRIALGWLGSELHAHLDERHYKSDPTRKLTDIKTTDDGVGVIEHLKGVLRKQLVLHARKLGIEIERDVDIRGLMHHLPPYDRLTDLFIHRAEKLMKHRGIDKAAFDKWLAGQRFDDGRYMTCTATCGDVAKAIEHIEKQIPPPAAAKEAKAQ